MTAVILGADHAGQALLAAVTQHLRQQGSLVLETPEVAGDASYPQVAAVVAQRVLALEGSMGCLVCGTGQGMAIAANKYPGIRAALCTHEMLAELARAHNDANVLCLGGRILAPELACQIVSRFFQTPFEGGRHAARVASLTSLSP